MYQTPIDTVHAEAVAPSAAAFTPLERTVLVLAHAERGRGLLPTTGIGRFFTRLSLRLFGHQSIQPLADPRLEALRSFVNAQHHCGHARASAAETLRRAGFDPLQESWLRSTFARCA
ncbi:hypothetical protein [Sphingomonas montana]|uniref:hypothetical protein n=1 Tax=Sphingomonas montana TaxID=1843236 RepID=UPI00096D3909|nr:hypothetical protein [Sphingomonas montana]